MLDGDSLFVVIPLAPFEGGGSDSLINIFQITLNNLTLVDAYLTFWTASGQLMGPIIL